MTAPLQTATSVSAPKETGRRFHWLLRVGFTMAAMYLFLAPVILAMLAISPLNIDPERPFGFVAMELPSLLAPMATIALVWVLMRYVDRRPLREAGLGFDAKSIPLLIVGSVLMAAISMVASFGVAAFGPQYEITASPFPHPWMAIVDLLFRSLIHASFCEELLFRGYLMQTLPFRNPWIVALISAAAFGAMHLVSQGAQVGRFEYAFAAFGFAFLAAAMVLVFRSIWPAVGVHFGTYVADDITNRLGWGAGPVTWLACGIAATVVGAIFIAVHTRRHPQVPEPLFASEA